MKNIKVLQILNRLNIGGVSLIVLNLCLHNNENTEVKLLTGLAEKGEGDATKLVEKKGISPILLPEMKRSLNFKNDKLAYKKIRAFIRQYQPDVVHTHAAKPGALGRLAAYHEKVPVIVHTYHGHVFEGYFGKIKSQFYINIERYLAKKSTKIIAISASQKKDFIEKFKIAKASKFEVINNGFDLKPFQENMAIKRKEFRNNWNIQDDEVCIGIIGRLAPIKNIGFFLESIKLLKEATQRKIKILIIGDGEERQFLEQKTKDLELSNCVTFTSWVNPIDKAYAGIDVLALSSKNEGTPTTLIEGQAAGIPIVATNVGGVADIVLANDSAFLVESDDLYGFAKQLQKVIESDGLRLSMGEIGEKYALEHFTIEKMIDKTYLLYNDLLNEKM